MGEVKEMVLNGLLCQICGVYIGNKENYLQSCLNCKEVKICKTYVTFGTDHKHYVNNKHIDFDCIAVIKCIDHEDGRKKAFQLFGTKFCMEYHEEDFKYMNSSLYSRGLIAVN